MDQVIFLPASMVATWILYSCIQILKKCQILYELGKLLGRSNSYKTGKKFGDNLIFALTRFHHKCPCPFNVRFVCFLSSEHFDAWSANYSTGNLLAPSTVPETLRVSVPYTEQNLRMNVTSNEWPAKTQFELCYARLRPKEVANISSFMSYL